MRKSFIAAGCACLLASSTCIARQGVEGQAGRLELQGQFKQAASLLATALQDKSLPAPERKKLEFELDRLDRIKKDFPLTKEELFADLKELGQGSDDRGIRAMARGRALRLAVRSTASATSCAYERQQSLLSLPRAERAPPAARRIPPHSRRRAWKAFTTIKKAALAEKNPYVLPKRFHVTMTVTAKPMPHRPAKSSAPGCRFPRHYPFQDDFTLSPPRPP